MTNNPINVLTAIRPATEMDAHLRFDQQELIRERILSEARPAVTPVRWAHRRTTAVGISALGLAAASAVILTTTPVVSQRRDPAPKTADFKTVAQVVSAAAAAPGPGDPNTGLYWEHAQSWPCMPRDRYKPATGRCGMATWTGNDRPSVYAVDGTRVFAAGMSQVETETIEGHDYTFAQLNAHQWTTAEIASLLRGGFTPGPPMEVFEFNNATYLLDEAPINRAIRQQIWARLGQIRGVRLDGRATDTLGRSGWRISQVVPGWVDTSIVVDPVSGRILETADRGDDGSTFYRDTTYLGPVNTAPAVNAKYEPLLPPVSGSH